MIRKIATSLTDLASCGATGLAVLGLALFFTTLGAWARPLADDSQSSKAAFAEAQQFLARGDMDSALGRVKRGLEGAPHSVEGLNLLGLILTRQGKSQEALDAFQSALKVSPQSVVTHNNLGIFYVSQNKTTLAENEFRASLRVRPSDRDANYNLGVLLVSGGHPKEAVAALAKVHPPDVSALFYLTRAYLDSGQIDDGLRTAKSLSELGKQDLKVHFSLGALLASKKQYAAAEKELEAADVLSPGTFEILFNLGEAYLGDGKAGPAEITLLRATKLQPDSAEALYLLARAQVSQGKEVDGLEALVRAHQIAPQNTDVIFLMARLAMKQHYYEDAIPLLDEGIKVAPERADLHAALGESYFLAGRVDKAFQEFQTLIKIHPVAPSYAFMGLYYRHLGQFDEAEKYFKLGLAQDPANAACLYNMGFIANHQGNYAQAESWLEKALRADPEYTEALSELGAVKMSEKKYSEAISLLRKCTQIDTNPAPVYYRLMTAERKDHQLQAADRDLKIFQTLSKDPNPGPYPFEQLFDYLNKRAGLPAVDKAKVDVGDLQKEIEAHPDRPRNFYMLAEAWLKLGKRDEAEKAVARFDQLSGGDARSAEGVGVLLARYQLYPEAIAHFQTSLQADPNSDDVKYDLAVAYFRMGQHEKALSTLQQISASGWHDDSVFALWADVDTHMGRIEEATEIYRGALKRNPDNDQYYFSLALAEMRAGQMQDARTILRDGLARIPDSGKLYWGLGVLSAAEGNAQQGIEYLTKSIGLLPEWPGSYAALGILYYQTGQIEKARDTLRQVSQNGLQASFDVGKIEQALSDASQQHGDEEHVTPLTPETRRQFLQLTLALADGTL